jgi:hypothetical protein
MSKDSLLWILENGVEIRFTPTDETLHPVSEFEAILYVKADPDEEEPAEKEE